MITPQYLRHLVNSVIAQLLGQGAHHDAAEIGLGGKALHDSGIGSYQQIILVHAPVVVAF